MIKMELGIYSKRSSMNFNVDGRVSIYDDDDQYISLAK